MAQHKKSTVRRILIASGNPLFGRGLEKILRQRNFANLPEIRLTSSMTETQQQMDEWQPELVIVDYEDHTIDRSTFLSFFVANDTPMQVMLVSLKASGTVVVYDRKTLTPAQAENWLKLTQAD